MASDEQVAGLHYHHTSTKSGTTHTTIKFYALEIFLTEWTTARGAAGESVFGERRVLSKVAYG